ncbi:MAG: phenylalanine--tRNA ligase beta subunit-related protein [Candidatus Eisenbacteria bacterium]
MEMKIELAVENADLILGIVEADGVVVGESAGEFRKEMEGLVAKRAGEDFPAEERRTAIRKLLRAGGFKAAGRNKPASEYLAGRAKAGEYPFHSNLVDICNHVSLTSGLPISILDLDLALGDDAGLVIRLGGEKESYVFNPSGQEIDITGLVCVARAEGEALGSPVKDSMRTKVHAGTRRVVAVIYGSKVTVGGEEMRGYVEAFGELLKKYAGAERVETRVID